MSSADVNNLLPRLQRWYSAQCDGEWEHRRGVTIQTLDNPGWLVKVDLAGTALENTPFVATRQGTDEAGLRHERDWFDCRVTDGVWQGAGDGARLAHLIQMFLSWAEQSQ